MRGWQRLIRCLSSAWRPCVAVLALLCVLLGTIGFPIVRPKNTVGETPFPCQHHACGCVSAEACWKNCCCFTPEQKLAWARKRGITPPAYAVAARAEIGIKPAKTAKVATCCSLANGKTATDCGAKKCSDAGTRASSREAVTFEIAIGDLARHCQGLPSWWAVFSAALPPAHVEFSHSPEPVAWLRVESCAAVSTSTLPAVPPPRARPA